MFLKNSDGTMSQREAQACAEPENGILFSSKNKLGMKPWKILNLY